MGASDIGEMTGDRDWRARYPEFCARAKGTNVNDRTLLATDYLNHVNEIIMLLELVPDAPECLEDCRAWQPMSYTEHFEASSIADRDLAIEAYAFSPPEFRGNFDRLIAEMHRVIAGALARVEAATAQGDEERVRRVIELAVGRAQDHGRSRQLHHPWRRPGHGPGRHRRPHGHDVDRERSLWRS